MPVIKSATEIEAYANWLNNANGTNNLPALVIKTALENSDYYFVSPAFNGSSKARDQVGELLKYCFTTQTDDIEKMISDAFKKAIDECLADA